LRAANEAVKAALDDTKRQVAEATLAIAKKSEAREKKITGELQIIEGLIRDFATNVAAKQKAQTVSATRAGGGLAVASTDPAMLDIIRRALEENRVDLYLQPIVGLPQRKLRFYEALSRLRSDDGAIIMPDQYIKVAGPAGLMSVVDNLLLLRCVQIVRRLTQKQRELAVFCNISAPTLSDPEFFPQFLDFMHHHRDLAGHIIFEFTQEAVLAARATEEANLRYLANLGFRQSIDQVTKLDVDFAKLRRLGFQFFKVKAETLISGMKQANSPVAAGGLEGPALPQRTQSHRRAASKTRKASFSFSNTMSISAKASCSACPSRSAKFPKWPMRARRRRLQSRCCPRPRGRLAS
jgi:cyclic-di-GMP phosphodiesterase TipF (flagellum assembly factor)